MCPLEHYGSPANIHLNGVQQQFNNNKMLAIKLKLLMKKDQIYFWR